MASNKNPDTFCGQAPVCTVRINNANGENASGGKKLQREKKKKNNNLKIIITQKVTIPWFGTR